MFDALACETVQRFSVNIGDAQGLLSSLLGVLFDPRSGGMTGIEQRFRRHGFGPLFSSWLGGSRHAEPISAQELDNVLGPGVLADIADRLGLAWGIVAAAASAMLPQIVGKLTPQGRLPRDIPDEVRGYLVGLPGCPDITGSLGSAAGLAAKRGARAADGPQRYR